MAYQNTYYLLLDATLADVGHVLRKADGAALRRLREIIRTASRVIVAGEGRARLIMQLFALHLADLGLRVGTIQPEPEPVVAEGDLLLIGSATGSEAALVQHAQRARDLRARVALITGAARSPLMQYADHTVVLDLPPRAESELFVQILFVLLEIQHLQLAEDLAHHT